MKGRYVLFNFVSYCLPYLVLYAMHYHGRRFRGGIRKKSRIEKKRRIGKVEFQSAKATLTAQLKVDLINQYDEAKVANPDLDLETSC